MVAILKGGGIEVAWADGTTSNRASEDILKHAPLKVFSRVDIHMWYR